MNRNDLNCRKSNKRAPFAGKFSHDPPLIKIQRQNGSLESREQRTSNNRFSKQKFITKQPSSGQLKPPVFSQNKLFAATTINKNYFSQNTNNENNCKQDDTLKNLTGQIKHKIKQNAFEMGNNILNTEVFTSPSIKYKDLYHNLTNTENNKDFRSRADVQNQYFKNHFGMGPLKCQQKYCHQQAVCFGERKDTGDDYVKCLNCREKEKDKRIVWKNVQFFKIPECAQISEVIGKVQNIMSKIIKSKSTLEEHRRSFLSEFQYQVIQHNNYYNSLAEIIEKKRKETLETFENSMRQAEYQFQEIKQRINKYHHEISKIYNDIFANCNRIHEMNELDRKNVLTKFLSQLPSQQSFSKIQLPFCQVKTNENLCEFQKDIQKYILRIVENGEDNKSANTSALIQTPLEEYNDCLDELACDQEFQWGPKPKPKKVYPQVNEMYFSFEKHNSIIYQNSQQQMSSPGFKQN